MRETKSEQEILNERINNDLVAFGEFSAYDLIENSVHKLDFLELEPNEE